MHLSTLPLLLLSPSHLPSALAQIPTCADHPAGLLPKLSDCHHVISWIERQIAETGNPLYTAARREHANFHLPNIFWDHLPESTCGVRLDMVEGKGQASDEVRLSDIAFATQKVVTKCLERERGFEGWMRAGRWGFVNVTVERLHWDGRGRGILRLGGGNGNGTGSRARAKGVL